MKLIQHQLSLCLLTNITELIWVEMSWIPHCCQIGWLNQIKLCQNWISQRYLRKGALASSICKQLGVAASFDDLVKFGDRRQIKWSQIFIKLCSAAENAKSWLAQRTTYGWWLGGPSHFWVVRQSKFCWDHATNQKIVKMDQTGSAFY